MDSNPTEMVCQSYLTSLMLSIHLIVHGHESAVQGGDFTSFWEKEGVRCVKCPVYRAHIHN
jgi:hypothetical protein